MKTHGHDQTGGNLMLAERQNEPRKKIHWQKIQFTQNGVVYDVGYYYIEGVESTVDDIFAVEIEGRSFYEDALHFDLLGQIFDKLMF